MTLPIAHARAAWTRAQALDRRLDASLHDVVARTGWIRTLGGAEAYLALHARGEGVTVAGVHEAVSTGELRVVPAVRGCIYLVPRTDAPLALAVADALASSRTARDLDKAGVRDGELEAVGEAVLQALEGQRLSTNDLRKVLPDGVVRSLGDAGKKVGITSTLPPALRRLELLGRIARRNTGDRLDHERYDWVLSEPEPAPADPMAALAERYFRWAGPATLAAFRAWSGLGARDAKAAVAAIELDEVEVERVGTCLVAPGALDVPIDEPARASLLPAMDNLFGLPENPAGIVDPEHAEVEVSSFGRPRTARLGAVSMPLDRVVAVGARVAGLWAWDPDASRVVVTELGTVPAGAVAAEVPSVRQLFADLGHGRAFSLDKDDALRERVALVKAASA